MSIYSTNETGTKMYRTRFNLSHRKLFDCEFGYLIPAMAKFVLPGDVWKCGANMLIRYQPMLAPPLTRSWARVRYFFVPLRLVEPNTEKIITGSNNGKLITTELPVFDNLFAGRNSNIPVSHQVIKYSFYDYLGVPVGDYNGHMNDECLPAQYWEKAYSRIWFDFYRDENLSDFNDFEELVTHRKMYGGSPSLHSANIHKDYFTSALPFQLKGVAPTIEISGGSVDFTNSVLIGESLNGTNVEVGKPFGTNGQTYKLGGYHDNSTLADTGSQVLSALNRNTITGIGSINMDDLRTMAAQTRVFERLARCGSRYTSYLQSNFNTAPADGTLQRAQYLGGFKQPIVTTEVVTTGASEDNPVGTMRGHGISNGGNTINPFVAKEFGMIFAILDITPEMQYTQGIDRELTYKRRFDFFNPSFQHLSEQEVRNGELYISNDGKNDDTFGYQAIYNELRTSRDLVVGDLRDTLSYWTQAPIFTGRPNLNESLISAKYHQISYKRPFAVQNVKPIIVDFGNILDVYRPMVKYGTPGLVDHL